MSVSGYVLGRCSACGGQAKKSPVSARWWHLGSSCPQTSMFASRPVRWYSGGMLGPTDATERPAHFVADTP